MRFILSLLVLLIASSLQAQNEVIKINDLEVLNNTRWKGQLSYRDYQSGEWTPVDATMQISIKGNRIKTAIQYSYEPDKNRTSTVKLKDNGKYFGNERVLSNKLSEGFRTIITTYEGQDDNRPATIYITHKFNDNQYTIRKEVLYKDSTDKLLRNSYEFSKL